MHFKNSRFSRDLILLARLIFTFQSSNCMLTDFTILADERKGMGFQRESDMYPPSSSASSFDELARAMDRVQSLENNNIEYTYKKRNNDTHYNKNNTRNLNETHCNKNNTRKLNDTDSLFTRFHEIGQNYQPPNIDNNELSRLTILLEESRRRENEYKLENDRLKLQDQDQRNQIHKLNSTIQQQNEEIKERVQKESKLRISEHELHLKLGILEKESRELKGNEKIYLSKIDNLRVEGKGSEINKKTLNDKDYKWDHIIKLKDDEITRLKLINHDLEIRTKNLEFVNNQRKSGEDSSGKNKYDTENKLLRVKLIKYRDLYNNLVNKVEKKNNVNNNTSGGVRNNNKASNLAISDPKSDASGSGSVESFETVKNKLNNNKDEIDAALIGSGIVRKDNCNSCYGREIPMNETIHMIGDYKWVL